MACLAAPSGAPWRDEVDEVDEVWTHEQTSAVMSQLRGLGSRAVARWHLLLIAIALSNLILWCLSAIAVNHGGTAGPAATDAGAPVQLLLSAAYVWGCAFRSVLPVYDIPRRVLVDSRLSSVLVGRSVATVAELCFAAQWALIMHRVGVLGPDGLAHTVSLAIVPLVAVAELASWYAVLTTTQRGHVVENSLWGVAGALVVASLMVIGPRRLVALYYPTVAWCVAGVAYVGFIFLVDVPMYWSRWRADQASRRSCLSLSQGWLDVRHRRVVSYRWEDWKSEVPWMSLYFSLGVWCSVSLVYASLSPHLH